MTLECLTLNIDYNLTTRTFKTHENFHKEQQYELIENFLISEKILSYDYVDNKDLNESEKEEIYDIQIKWYQDKNEFEIIDNIGDKKLRDKILHAFLDHLSN